MKVVDLAEARRGREEPAKLGATDPWKRALRRLLWTWLPRPAWVSRW